MKFLTFRSMTADKKLTVEILKYNLGFEVFDLGDYWQAEKFGLCLVQPKLSSVPVEMPFYVGYPKTDPVEQAETVKELQDIFLRFTGEELKISSIAASDSSE